MNDLPPLNAHVAAITARYAPPVELAALIATADSVAGMLDVMSQSKELSEPNGLAELYRIALSMLAKQLRGAVNSAVASADARLNETKGGGQ